MTSHYLIHLSACHMQDLVAGATRLPPCSVCSWKDPGMMEWWGVGPDAEWLTARPNPRVILRDSGNYAGSGDSAEPRPRTSKRQQRQQMQEWARHQHQTVQVRGWTASTGVQTPAGTQHCPANIEQGLPTAERGPRHRERQTGTGITSMSPSSQQGHAGCKDYLTCSKVVVSSTICPL